MSVDKGDGWVRRELDVTAFGVNAIVLPAGSGGNPLQPGFAGHTPGSDAG